MVTPVRAALAAVALAFALWHGAHLGQTADDIDAVNFAAGVEQYDIRAHQPHPPGYPVYIALGKVATALTARGEEALPHGHAVRGLGLVSAVLGGLAIFPLFALFRAVGLTPWTSVASSTLVLASPLYWFTASRPMSDVPGLCLALAAQALLLSAFARQREPQGIAESPQLDREALVASGTAIVAGALVAGLAIGVRSQAAWLTMPVLVLVLVDRAGRGAAGALLGATMTGALGVVVWALPMVIATGGPGAYWAALGSQGTDDFRDVAMLFSHPSRDLAIRAVLRTFPVLWGALVPGLLLTMLAAIGSVVAIARDRRALMAMACAYGPYLLFHLAFHDIEHTRYALPLIVPVVWLVARALRVAGEPAARVLMVAGAVWSVAVASPRVAAYAAAASPSVTTLQALNTAISQGEGQSRTLMLHHAFAIAWRRDLRPMQNVITVRTKPWTSVSEYWASGRTAPLWFVAEPGHNGLDRHHALALIDPASRVVRAQQTWSFDSDPYLSGARPSTVTWYDIPPPGWFATAGWALTPSLGGIAERDGVGPAQGGITAFIRRRDEAAAMIVGGRHLGVGDVPDATFVATLDGRSVATWTVKPGTFFVQRVSLPEGALAGADAYARLRITAADAAGSGAVPRVAVEQFDVQTIGRAVMAYGEGWHEPEYSNARDLAWRWTSASATVLIVRPRPATLWLHMRGESPLRYFAAAPTVRVVVGERVLHTFTPTADFDERIVVPADVPHDGDMVAVRIETSETFVPAERRATQDARRLGLRVYDVRVSSTDEVSRPAAGTSPR